MTVHDRNSKQTGCFGFYVGSIIKTFVAGITLYLFVVILSSLGLDSDQIGTLWLFLLVLFWLGMVAVVGYSIVSWIRRRWGRPGGGK